MNQNRIVSIRATVSNSRKLHFTRKRNSPVVDDTMNGADLITTMADALETSEEYVMSWFGQGDASNGKSRIHRFTFALLCIVLQHDFPHVCHQRIVRIALGFLKHCDHPHLYLKTAVHRHISEKVCVLRQKHPELSSSDCNGIVTHSLLWNVTRFFGAN